MRERRHIFYNVVTDENSLTELLRNFMEYALFRQLFFRQVLKLTEVQVPAADEITERTRQWAFDNYFLLNLQGKFNQASKKTDADKAILKAIRMLIFHEALHFSKHKMLGAVANGIGSFPRVLEDADYQADVYAMLYDFDYTITSDRNTSAKQFFILTIQTAIQTMWSFSGNTETLTEIQIRSFNRFLIWYWQLARIEKSEDSVERRIKILANKPLIECSGPYLFSRNQRVYYGLNHQSTRFAELAIFYNNRIIRNAGIGGATVQSLLDGFRTRNGNAVQEVLRTLVNIADIE